MVQKQCPRCGQVSALHAPTCAKCGRVFRTRFDAAGQPVDAGEPGPQCPSTTQREPPREPIGPAKVAIVFGIALVVCLYGMGDEAGKNKTTVGDKTEAQVVAQMCVRSFFAAPDTVRFSNCDRYHQGNGAWMISGTVSYKNLFGVPLKTSYIARILFAPGSGYTVEQVWLHGRNYPVNRTYR